MLGVVRSEDEVTVGDHVTLSACPTAPAQHSPEVDGGDEGPGAVPSHGARLYGQSQVGGGDGALRGAAGAAACGGAEASLKAEHVSDFTEPHISLDINLLVVPAAQEGADTVEEGDDGARGVNGAVHLLGGLQVLGEEEGEAVTGGLLQGLVNLSRLLGELGHHPLESLHRSLVISPRVSVPHLLHVLLRGESVQVHCAWPSSSCRVPGAMQQPTPAKNYLLCFHHNDHKKQGLIIISTLPYPVFSALPRPVANSPPDSSRGWPRPP